MKRSNRHLPVILNEDVDGLGFAGELANVKSGYARNFLLPTKLAVLATPKLIADRKADITKATARRESEVTRLKELAEQLGAEPVKLKLKVGPAGQVFGSVAVADLTKAVKDQRKLELSAKHVTGLPLKTIGSATVSAKLGLGVLAEIHIQIAGEKTAPATDQAPDAKKKASQPQAKTATA